MPYISEVASIFIQRFYTGWITLRNQLATPIRLMGRRVIELYDTLITGNDWEVTPYLSLKRRAGHTRYVALNYPALNMVSWKSNTMGTIPVFDTADVLGGSGADIEYINSSGTNTVVTAKSVFSQCGILGIGNYFYMGNTPTNLKWDGPTGTQQVTNWGISISNSSTTYGPQTAGTGTNVALGAGNTAWTNPSDVTGSSGYSTMTLGPGNFSDYLYATNFNFSSLSIPASDAIIGVTVSFSGAATGTDIGAQLVLGGYPIGSPKYYTGVGGSPAPVVLGGSGDPWGALLTVSGVTQTSFGVSFFSNTTPPTGTTTAQVNNVQLTVYTNSGITPTPTGSGTFSAVNGYTYVMEYGNSVSGEVSNASPPSVNTGPFTNVSYVGIPVVASSDTQVNQIRIYRTTDSGGGNQFFEISNSPFPNTSATIQDTTVDTSLQVTSQAEINLGNTPPPAGLVNLEWFAGRMWGSVNNILWASTGPETLSGTAPNSNWNPLFQWVIPGVIVRLVTGPNGMLIFTQDECYIVRGTDIENYTVNLFVKDFGIRSYNCVDTDGTNLYVFTSDRQFICISSSGANDMGLSIGDQLLSVDPTQAYVKVNRYGLDSIVRILDTVNNVYYDYNLNQQCWNLPGILQMPDCTAAGSIEVSPGVWRLLLCSNVYTVTDDVYTLVSSTLAYRDITNWQDLGTAYAPNAVFGSIQLADPGTLAKFGALGGFNLQWTNAGTLPTLSVLPNDIGATLSNGAGAQITGNFVSLSVPANGFNFPPSLGMQPSGYRSVGYYWMFAKALSAFVVNLQFQVSAPAENTATEMLGFAIFGDQKQEVEQAAPLPQLQGR
jgi:hypothetical protein